MEDFLKQRDTWLAFTCVLGIIFLVIVCLFIFLRQRILIAIALIEQVKLTNERPPSCHVTVHLTNESAGFPSCGPHVLKPLLPPGAVAAAGEKPQNDRAEAKQNCKYQYQFVK